MNSLFKTLATSLATAAAAIGFYGCDSANLDALKPGIATAQEVRDRLGPPAAEWANPDGSVTWEYPRGPEGVVCWMLTLSAPGERGLLQKKEQALTEENFSRIEKGWTPQQVRRLLGKPKSEVKFPLKPEIVWEWRIATPFPNNRAFFHVHFTVDGGPESNTAGTVTGTSRREETPGG
jgi:hypothetical protein